MVSSELQFFCTTDRPAQVLESISLIQYIITHLYYIHYKFIDYFLQNHIAIVSILLLLILSLFLILSAASRCPLLQVTFPRTLNYNTRNYVHLRNSNCIWIHKSLTSTYLTLPPQYWHSGPCQPSLHKHAVELSA